VVEARVSLASNRRVFALGGRICWHNFWLNDEGTSYLSTASGSTLSTQTMDRYGHQRSKSWSLQASLVVHASARKHANQGG
jgi:hypothetical protein